MDSLPALLPPLVNVLVTLLHLGDLHPFEQALVGVIAFGPFIVLGIVVYVIRKRDLAAEEREAAEGLGHPDGPPPA